MSTALHPQGPAAEAESAEAMATITGAMAGLYVCHACGLASRAAPQPAASQCPRCGAAVHRRKPASLLRTWALMLAALVLYIPANVLPVMKSSSLFGAQQDTIWSGIVFLWNDGSYGLAGLVFFASMTVPVAKLVVLAYLAASVQMRSKRRPLLRTRLYRMVESVGRWSMLDIYVVTALVGLVQLQSLAKIEAGPGALAFGAVVVLTMLAAMSFDPRLIWDAIDHGDDPVAAARIPPMPSRAGAAQAEPLSTTTSAPPAATGHP